MSRSEPSPAWMRGVLILAGLYNIAWGAWVILWPDALFVWSGEDPLNHPDIWRCVGMIVGVYGVGYLAASTDPLRHWPIVLVGLLGKVLGPIGFLDSWWNERLPSGFAATIVTNDLVWWVPFGVILWRAFRAETTTADTKDPGDPIAELPSDAGPTLAELSQQAPVLAVLLRHAGCTFHREALADLSAARPGLDAAGITLAVVHMGDGPNTIEQSDTRYALPGVPHVSDPRRLMYQRLGLPRGGFRELFGPMVFRRGFSACVLKGHGVGGLCGDGFQLGGLALVRHGRVVWSRPLTSAAERPDYAAEARRAVSLSDRVGAP